MNSTKFEYSLWRICPAALTAFTLSAVPAFAQQTASPPAGGEDEEMVILSPFTVEGSEDLGYQAQSTLAGTRIRTELKDVASSIQVVTKDFLQDTGATDSSSLLQYTTNTEVGGVYGNFSGNAGGLQFNEDRTLRRPQSNTRVRGLDAADNTRDFFLSEIPWDSFNTSRVDIQRGPNSILFGVGSPAGIINASLNTAGYQSGGSFENRFDQFGGFRNSLDYNYVVIEDELSIRGAVLDDRQKFRQDQAYADTRRYYAAARWNPKLFGEGTRTEIRANFENGKTDANRPRTLPPVDAISPWFWAGQDDYGNPYLNKFTYDASQVDPNSAPFNGGGIYPYAWLNNGAVGRQFWSGIVGSQDASGVTYRQAAPSGANGLNAAGEVGQGGIGALPQARVVGVANYSSYHLVSGAPGGSYYADRTLANSSIFDFYNNLIDGDNKYENQDWNAGNLAISQTYLDDRIGWEFVYDVQEYSEESRVFLGNSDTYKIGVDIVSHFHDGSPNPNVGRAYVASSTESQNRLEEIDRDGLRFTAFGEVRGSDFFSEESTLAKILGRNVFTGLLAQDTKDTALKNWATSAATNAYTQFMGEPDSLTAHHRSYDYVAYISGDLRDRVSADGAGLTPVNWNVVAPSSATSVFMFDNNWPAGSTVNPADPFTYTPVNGNLPVGAPAPVDSTQSDNPANYGGWINRDVAFLHVDNGDIDQLTYNRQKIRNRTKSIGLTWQGFLFDGLVVPTVGWREDTVTNEAGNGSLNDDGISDPNFDLNPDSRSEESGTSLSYGVVVHLPRDWTKFLGEGTSISAFANNSENFKADAIRGDIFGNAIPNPLGETKEYGAVVSILEDKLSFKATWYETKVANATLPGSNPLGQNSYFLWAVPAWGTAFTVNADQGIKGNNDGNSWAWNYAATDDPMAPPFRLEDGTLNPEWQNHPSTVQLKNAIEAWREIPLDQNFFDAYGNEVALIQAAEIRAGNWTAADPIWNQKFDNQPVAGGVLEGFGTTPAFTVDTKSEGWEFEIYAKPARNWNVTVNASKTFATRTDLAPTTVELINAMTDFLAGPAGDIRLWGGGASNSMRNQWQNNILNPYTTFKSGEGSQAPEIAPWRLNAITTYSFDEGRFKGTSVGGAIRWEDSRVLGYKYDPNIGPNGALDINDPWKSSSNTHVDLWIAYRRKLTDKINWRIQANVRNVGESVHLEPVSVNPDGEVAFSRIQEGMIWQLTNSFEF